jgi:anthranilate/para-aminobenzoate synthase component II
MAGELPILGVCLGLQCIGETFGGRVARADRLMHGKTSPIIHDGKTIFAGIPSPFEAMRYHSLLVDPASARRRWKSARAQRRTKSWGCATSSTPSRACNFIPNRS